MSIKKITERILRYLFLLFFVLGLLAALYGVKRMDQGQFREIFSKEGGKV